MSKTKCIDFAIECEKRKILLFKDRINESRELLAQLITARNLIEYAEAEIEGIVNLCLTGK